MISGHGTSSSYESQQGAASFLGRFSGMLRALNGSMLARAPASPAQGLHCHRPAVLQILGNLGLLIKTDWNVFCPLYR